MLPLEASLVLFLIYLSLSGIYPLLPSVSLSMVKAQIARSFFLTRQDRFISLYFSNFFTASSIKGASLLPQIKSYIAKIFFNCKNTSFPYIFFFFLFILLFLPITYFTFLPYTFAYPIVFPSLKFKF